MVEPLRPLTLEDEHKAKYAFRPQSDITPLEAVLISQLFTRMVMTVWSGPIDWPTYVSEHKLDRHFTCVALVPATVSPPPPLEDELDKLIVRISKRVEYIATRDISEVWLKGQRLTLLEGMPVPEGFVPVQDELGKGEVR